MLKTKELERFIAQKGDLAANASNDEEIADLRKHAHALGIENEKLFDQVTVLREYYEKFDAEQRALQNEANKKIMNFESLKNELDKVTRERDQAA